MWSLTPNWAPNLLRGSDPTEGAPRLCTPGHQGAVGVHCPSLSGEAEFRVQSFHGSTVHEITTVAEGWRPRGYGLGEGHPLHWEVSACLLPLSTRKGSTDPNKLQEEWGQCLGA